MNLQALALITPPAYLPVTLAEAKAHLRIDHSDEDALIRGLIGAATSHIQGRDGYTGQALVPQTWEYYLDQFPTDPLKAIAIPLPPLIAVESIKYLDADGAEQTLATSVYAVNTATEPGAVSLKQDQSWPDTRSAWDAVRIRFQAGYLAFGDSPTSYAGTPIEVMQSAILLVLADLYENRQAGGHENYEINPTLKRLLYPLRKNIGI